MTRRRKTHAAALFLLIVTTAPGFALLCRGRSPSRFATPNLPFWERAVPQPIPPRVTMWGFPTPPDADGRSATRLAQTDPEALFSVLEHPSRKRPSPAGAGRPGLWLLAACALDRPGPAVRCRQDTITARLMDAQHDDGYLAAGIGTGRWSGAQITAYSQNLRGLLAYYAVSRSPASVHAAMQAGDLVVEQFPPAALDPSRAVHLVLPLTLLYQATGEPRYRRWAEQCAAAGVVDGPGLCALYAATGEKHYLRAAQRTWGQEYACHRTDPDLAASLWVLTGDRQYHTALHTLAASRLCPIIPGRPSGTRSLASPHVSATWHSPSDLGPLTPHLPGGLHHGGG